MFCTISIVSTLSLISKIIQIRLFYIYLDVLVMKSESAKHAVILIAYFKIFQPLFQNVVLNVFTQYQFT